MKGKNTLKLNHATMVEAMQQWLSSTLAGHNIPSVTAVRIANTASFGTLPAGNDFEIDIESKDSADA